MGMKELPPDWDWVTARSECSPRKFFEHLYLAAQTNVAKRNELSGAKAFGCAAQERLFSVFRDNPSGSLGSPVVRFRLEGDGKIVVEAQDVKAGFQGRLTLSDEGKCRLSVGSDELDVWQVLKRALEPLFFD